jgi:hypothetical protein
MGYRLGIPAIRMAAGSLGTSKITETLATRRSGISAESLSW